MKRAYLFMAAVLSLGIAHAEAPQPTSTALPSTETTPQYPYGVDQGNPDNYEAVLDLALRGNYQAQRNVAYSFVARVYHNNHELNPVLGCAWYLVVLNSGSRKVGVGDQSNAQVYCGKLEPDLLEAAKSNATRFMAEINENTKFGKLDD